MASERYTTGEVIEALRKARGIKAVAAKLLGCDRHTVDNYITRHPTVARAYEEQRQTIVDIAEGQLVKKLDAGEWPAVRYTLSTLGRDRGYVERVEQQVTGNVTLGYSGNVDPDDDL